MDLSVFRGKTILVSGATGMIGSQVVRRLEEVDGANVVALYRDARKKDRLFPDPSRNVEWVSCDINRPFDYEGHVDYVVHTAGVTGGSKKHVDFPLRTINTAVFGTENLLELARRNSVDGFVYLSSLEVYGKTDASLASIRECDGGYIDPVAVRSSYSESKRMCETICAAYHKQYGVPAKIVRLAPTYGRGASWDDNRVLCEFGKCIIEGRDIVLRSTGDTVRNYCDVDDAVEAILLVLTRGQACEAYNVANMSTEISIRELAERFIRLYPDAGTKLRFDIAEDIGKLGYNQTIKVRLDSTRLQQLGWQPRNDLDRMIGNLVRALETDRRARGEQAHEEIQ